MKKQRFDLWYLSLLIFLSLGLSSCSEQLTETGELNTQAFLEPGIYILSNKHSEKVLDLPYANPQAGLQVWQYERNGTAAQHWRIEVLNTSWVKISSVLGDYALDGGTNTNGNAVRLEPYTKNLRSKQWRLIASQGGYYELVNRASSGRLEVANFSNDDGGLIQTWSANKADNQKWSLEKIADHTASTSAYHENLRLIKNASVRNRNLDNSSFRNTAMAHLPIGPESPLLGSRLDYIRGEDGSIPGNPGGNPEPNFAARNVGTFRISCEFSHFAYDDPLLYPNQPGAAHLHMFWGNTDVNAYSTYNSLRNSGSSTCNGMELNRTGYWAPAMFDAQGNVRIPERIIVYYKGYGLARGASQVYPPRAAMIIDDTVNRRSNAEGGAEGEFNFLCSDQFRGARTPASMTIPICGLDSSPWRRTLEMHVKFPNCWNGQDAANPDNWLLARYGSWFYSNCEYDGNKTFPNIHYIIAYPLEPNETTAGWYLSSDVDPINRNLSKAGGSTIHADWWGAWHPTINRRWINNCVNLKKDFDGDGEDDIDHGCGFGYLSDAGPDDNNPFPGPALKYRQQYTGPIKVPARTLYQDLCPKGSAIGSAAAAAYCQPKINNAPHHH